MMLLPLLVMAAQPAEPVEPPVDCANARTQQDMNTCAFQEFLAEDAKLNAQWEATADKMRQRDMMIDTSHDGRPGYFPQLLEGQRAWLTYRDEHCTVEGYLARGGSMEPLLVASCRTALTRERTQQLRELEVWPE